MKEIFKAKIYKTGINTCVDVPKRITNKMKPEKGYIKTKGTINGFNFKTTLVPVKDKPYRLFVNMIMLKGAQASLGDTPAFTIEQYFKTIKQEFPIPPYLTKALKEKNLLPAFNELSPSRRKEIIRYLSFIKTKETMQKNITKVIVQLQNKERGVRIP